jgi:hypothetical protein
VHYFAAPLLNGLQWHEFAGYALASFLVELTLGSREWIVVVGKLAFGNGPSAQIAVHPIWTTGVHEKKLQATRAAAIDE